VNGKGNNKSGGERGDPKKRPGGAGKPAGQSNKSRAPEQTFAEVRYLKYLIDNEIPIRVKLRDNSEVAGTVEYYDRSFIRLTRQDAPNLFIFKHEIKYLYEE
jgi:host factor-I protein